MSEERIKVKVVCTGRLLRATGEESMSFRTLSPDGSPGPGGTLGPIHTFGIKSCRKYVAGGVYTLDATDADLGTVWFAKYPRPEGYWPNMAERAEWQMADRAVDVAKALGKVLDEDAVAKVLEPLRRRYVATNATGRLALEVLLLRALRKPV